MASAMSIRRLVLLGVCMVMLFSEVKACEKVNDENPYNSDPCEDDVDSPPAMPYTAVPTTSPSGKPTRMPAFVPTTTPTFSPTLIPTIASTESSTQSPTLKPSTDPTKSPTPTPTIASTESPSQSPTLKPSTTPTKSPTGLPLTRVEPTISPSASPTATKNPTQSPAPTTTPSPTTTQKPSLSFSPSMTPSPTLTSAPTFSFSPSTTGAPSDSACAVTKDGFFGDASENTVVITFGYELEYEQGYNESEIISRLENSFTDYLLPLLFPSQCPEQRRVLTTYRRLETVGVSKRPDDVVLQDVTCAKKKDGYECVVLDGSMTIYTDEATASNDEEKIREDLKTGMESGAFVEAPIVRVSYVDLDTDPSGADSNGKGTTENTPKSKRFVYGVVAGVATLLILILAVVWRRKHKNEEASTLGPDSTVGASQTMALDGANTVV